MKRLIIGVVLLVAGTASAAEPTFYPNQRFRTAGTSGVHADVQRCRSEATQSGVGAQQGQAVRSGARGAVKGAAAGALVGAITKQNVGRATGAGAAVGGLAGTGRQLTQRGDNNPEFQKFVTACLEESGYRVTGWR